MPATRNQSPQVKGRLTRNASPRQSDRNCQDIKSRQTSPRGAGKAESITTPGVSGKGKNIEMHSRSSPRRVGKQEINDELPNEKSLKPQDTSIKSTRTRSSQGNNDTVKPRDIEKNASKDRSGRGLTRQEDADTPVADTKSKAAAHPKKPSIRENKEVNTTENNPSSVSCEEPQPQSKRRVGRPTKAQKNQQNLEDDLSAKVTTKSEGTVQMSKQGKGKASELFPADDNFVLKESTAEDSANRKGHKRRNDDHNNSTDKQETKRKKINQEFGVEIDGNKELGKTTLTAPSDDTFSPRRSGRGVVPNRRFKDMEMDFSPANKRRQSADDGEKPKTSSSVKRKTKSKAKEKETIVEPATVLVHKGDNESYSENLKQKDTSTVHISDNTGVLMDQTDHQDANLSVLVGRIDHQDMNPGVMMDRTDHQDMNPGVVVDRTDHQDMNPGVLVDKTDHQAMNPDVIVDRADEREKNQGVTEDHQNVVMESMETNWVEEEVVTADRELVIEHVGDETTTATFIAESESEEPNSALNTENQTLHSLENTEQFVSEANIEDIARQTMTLLMRENHLENSGANFVITSSSDAQMISDVEAIEETGQVKDLIEESEQGKDSVVIEATIENIRNISKTTVNETITTATEVTDTPDTDKQMAESGTSLESDSTATENNNTTITENDSTTVGGSKETEVNQTAEAVNNLEGYKVMKLEDVVHELRGNSKDSQITATRVTNVEKDVDEDIIRKILLSNKTFTDTDEIEIQFIGGDDSQNEVDEANILSEKIIAMRNITKSNMSSSATQTPIISSRVANLPGKGKAPTTVPEPSRMKTIRVNIQRPDGIEETKELQTEEGKAQEFVIVHLPEGTKVTRPKVKQDKTEKETVPFSLNDEGDFVCGVCEYTTPKKANWYKHKKKHMAQKPHCCEKCGYQASTSSNLKRHLAIHDDIRDFQCSYCFMTFRQKIHLERHVKYRHEVKKVKCPLCDYVCANENPDLKVHIKRRHLPQDSEDGSLRAFACDECGAMAVNRKDLKQHMKFHRKGPELKLYCEHCSFVTDCESRLRRHMFIHTNEKPFQCGLCAYRGTQKEHVLRHMKSQHNIDIHKKGRTLEELSADGSTDSRELLLDKKPYKTDYSSQEKIFACNHCSMKFSKLLNLYKHLHAQHKSILPDQGEDEYLCVVCDFRTGSKKNLLVHMRKHNVQDQNPPSHVYSCVLCRYMNPKRRNLFQHMKKKHNIEIVMRDDGSTSCFLTDSSSSVADKDDSVQNILTVGDIVTTTTDDSQLQIVMDACEKNAVQVQNVINIEDIANCVSNPQPNNSNIIILEQNQSNTVVQHEAAEAIEGLQALAEQPGIVESQEVITDSDSQTVTVEEVQTSKSLEEDMETEIVTMETEILKSFQPENVPEIKKDKETDIQLSEDQLMNLSTGDFVEINGEMYKVEISAEDGNNTENVVQGELVQTQVQAAEEQHVAVSDENAFQEFVQMMTECSDDTNTTTMVNETAENSEVLTGSQETALHIITSDASVNDCASHVVTTSDHDNLTVLAEITNAASVGDSSEYITIQGSVATDVTEPSNVMTVANSTSVDEGSVGVFETQ